MLEWFFSHVRASNTHHRCVSKRVREHGSPLRYSAGGFFLDNSRKGLDLCSTVVVITLCTCVRVINRKFYKHFDRKCRFQIGS